MSYDVSRTDCEIDTEDSLLLVLGLPLPRGRTRTAVTCLAAPIEEERYGIVH